MEKLKGFARSNTRIFYLLLFICCVIFITILKVASSVILPFTIAILLSLVMYPFVRLLDKLKVPRFLSILLVLVILIAGLYLFVFILITSGRSILAVHAEYEERVTEIFHFVARFADLSFDEDISIWLNIWGQLGLRTFIRNFALSFTAVVVDFATSAVLVILFILFILLEASFFKEKLRVAFDKRSERLNQIGHDIMTQVTRYIAAKFFISLANGIIFAVAFYFIGLEFAILWGVIQFIFNFIPNLGSITAGGAIILFSLVQFWPEPLPIILVLIVVFGVNLGLCNTLDPKIVGERVGISPFLVLVSLGVWGWIWGFAGMILAVPMTSIIKIICEKVPYLEPISVLIGTRKSVEAKRAEREKAAEEKAKMQDMKETLG